MIIVFSVDNFAALEKFLLGCEPTKHCILVFSVEFGLLNQLLHSLDTGQVGIFALACF